MSTPRFLADEDLRHRIVRAPQRLEPALEFLTVQDLGMRGAIDPDILEYAEANSLLLVSHDVNTMRGYAHNRIVAGLGISGLFLVSQNAIVREVAENLILVWSASEAEEWRDQIVFLPF